MNPGHYLKAVVAIFAAGLAILGTALQDSVLTPTEYVNIGIAIVTAVGVYAVPNFPAGVARYLKTGAAFAGAALQALVTILDGVNGWSEVTTSGWITVALAALAAVGVYALPNAPALSLTSTNNVLLASEAQGVAPENVATNDTPVQVNEAPTPSSVG